MKQTTRTLFTALALGTTTISMTAPAFAHCEIPCGIYDDEAKFDELALHIKTIKRSIEGISESKTTHDKVRWVINKENHAQKIQDEIATYFLAQRIKAPTDEAKNEEYVQSLELAHSIIVAAMKTKQSADMEKADILGTKIEAYRILYFKIHGHEH